jgi:hypothetical protein
LYALSLSLSLPLPLSLTHTGEYDAKESILAQMTEEVHPEKQILKRKPYNEFVQ